MTDFNRVAGLTMVGAMLLAPALGAQSPITVGTPITGSLDAGDRVLEDGSFYDLFSFTGNRGQIVRVTLRSDAFDAYLAIGKPGDAQGLEEALEEDDDSGGDTDSMVELELPADGTYAIRVNTLSEGETGAYTLSLEHATSLSTPAGDGAIAEPEQRLGLGSRITGRLEDSDPVRADESHYDAFGIAGRPGERMKVTLTSDDFDAYLHWGERKADGSFEEIETDDDSGGGTHAQLTIILPADGSFILLVSTLGGGETGSYTLEISRP